MTDNIESKDQEVVFGVAKKNKYVSDMIREYNSRK